MVEIKVLDNHEKKGGNAVVERAALKSIVSCVDACEVSNTDDEYIVERGGEKLRFVGGLSAKQKLVAYAYLDAMPILPSNTFDIKRLAPSLAETVANAVGWDKAAVDRLMRDSGVFGALCDSKLVGFIGQSHLGGMDLFHLYDMPKSHEAGVELIKFLTTLIMTGGQTPFAIVDLDDQARQVMLEECGFVSGELVAYTV